MDSLNLSFSELLDEDEDFERGGLPDCGSWRKGERGRTSDSNNASTDPISSRDKDFC